MNSFVHALGQLPPACHDYGAWKRPRVITSRGTLAVAQLVVGRHRLLLKNKTKSMHYGSSVGLARWVSALVAGASCAKTVIWTKYYT